MKVLLADENRDILLTYQKLFSLRGDSADCVFDGTQALSQLTAETYDLLIVSQSLPRIPAKDVIQHAKQQGIPAIALIDSHISSSVLISGPPAAAFLALPFSPDLLFGYADAVVQKAKEGAAFSVGGIPVDVRGMRFAESDVFLTSKEIDLLQTLKEQSVIIEGRHLSTYINALNNKFALLHTPCRIEYVLQKGYCMVNNNG